jgi:hypothetical protein
LIYCKSIQGIPKEVIMRITYTFIIALVTVLTVLAQGYTKADAAVVGKDVEYSSEGLALRGYTL